MATGRTDAAMVRAPDKLLRTLAAISPVAIVALDNEGVIRLWNQAAEKLFGWTKEEAAGAPFAMLVSGGQPDSAIEIASGLRDPLSEERSWRWLTKGGATIDVSARCAAWPGPEGATAGVLLTASRVPAEEMAELKHLAVEAERFRAVLEAAPDAIVKVDAAGRIVLVNRATETQFGYTREELIGQPVEILVPLTARGSHAGHRADYGANPVKRPMGPGMTLTALRKDGTEFPVEISLSPLPTDSEVRVVAMIRDVTERKRIERELLAMEHRFSQELAAKNAELERRNMEVEHADRLKSEFLASMSHELRTPLHTIIGFSQLMAEEIQGPLNEKQRRFVGHIRKDSAHLLELINDILDLSKIEAGRVDLRREVFPARAEMEDVIGSVRPAAEAKAIRMESLLERDYVLNADRLRFRQVLFNLLSNALKFTQRDGQITIGAHDDDSSEFCVFSVRDTGIGIPDTQLEAIFDKFHQVGATTKGVREGTGLGLTITRHIVELHGGRMRVESEPGKGSCFSFTMPLGRVE